MFSNTLDSILFGCILWYALVLGAFESAAQPIMDSNLGPIKSVCISSYVDITDCDGMINAIEQSKLVGFFIDSLNTDVCIVNHYQFCKEVLYQNREVFCDSISNLLAANEELARAEKKLISEYDKIASLAGFKRNGREKVENWAIHLNQGLITSSNYFLATDNRVEELTSLREISTAGDAMKWNLNDVNYVFNEGNPLSVTAGINTDDVDNWPYQSGLLHTEFAVPVSKPAARRILVVEKVELNSLLKLFRNYQLELSISLQKAVERVVQKDLKSKLDKSLNIEAKERISVVVLPHEDCEIRSEVHYKRHIGNYIQDRIHVRTQDYNIFTYGLSNENQRGIDLDFDYGIQPWFKNGNVTCLDSIYEPEQLRNIAGGNMFRLDTFLFIGRDALYDYETNDFALRQLKLRMPHSEQIQNKIQQYGFGNARNGRLIWVGTPNRVLDIRTTSGVRNHQPFYHIDLFFHPIKLVSDTLHCLIAEVIPFNKSALNEERLKKLDTVNGHINSTQNHIQSQLGSTLQVKWTEVPVAIKFDEDDDVERVISPINGISARRKNNHVTYLMPEYPEDEKNIDGDFHQRAEESIDSIVDTVFRVVGNENEYSHISGLNCAVKVIERGKD